MKKPIRAKKPQRASVRTPVEKLGKDDTIAHYNAVMIEGLRSDVKKMIEGVGASVDGLRTDLNDFRGEVNGRFDTIEAVLKNHSKTLADHSVKLENLQSTVDGHTKRLDSIDTKLDRIGTRVDDHESR